MKFLKSIMALVLPLLLLASCKKYREIRNAAYTDQKVYLPAAVSGVSTNGIYYVNTVASPGYAFRYVADMPNKKLAIPLSAYRSGVNTKGSINASLSVNADTVAKFLIAGKLPSGTELLPADKYSLPNSVTVEDSQDGADFSLSVDLNFLLANPTKKYALGLALSNSKGLGSSSVAIILIDPAFLTPTAAFTATVSGKTVTFSNTSTNAVSYSWDYGDGTPLVMDKASPHTYTAAGTYTVKLTTLGALGDFNKAVYTATVIIL